MPPLPPAIVLLRRAPGARSDGALASLRALTPPSVPVHAVADDEVMSADAHAGADLVIVEAGVALAAGWLDRLRATAHADSTTATASASRLERDAPAAPSQPVLPAAWNGPPPRLPAPMAGAVLIRASARALAGPYDERFAARCSGLALLHVLAPDVPALVSGASSPPPESEGREDDLPTGHRRARLWLANALAPIDVTVDGRSLTNTTGGTQVHALELIRALHRTRAVQLRVALPIDPDPAVIEELRGWEDVGIVDASTVTQYSPRTSVVHRPHQVTGPYDLLLLRRLGRRIVVTHQDLIGYHNPTYHADRERWQSFRNLTGSSLQVADLVVAFSSHARADLLAEDLVPSDRVAVIPLGADHVRRLEWPREPRGAPPEVGDEPFLLVLGSDLQHKNRPFAIRLLAELRRRHGWPGRLVLAGPHVPHGSSRGAEGAALAETGVGEHVSDLGAVDEDAKAWLLSNAAAVVYPTTYEGFGLVPFEAAAHGTPAVFAHGSSLADVLPPETALIVPWDPGATAVRVLPLLRDPQLAAAQAARIGAAGAELTWDRTAADLVSTYERALAVPPRDAVAAAVRALEAEDRFRRLREDVGDLGILLVGRSGLLPEDAQRALVGLTRRRATRRLVLCGLTAGRRTRRALAARLASRSRQH
jgi:glycosyltransferase involved in cell wall biosynthesis